MTTAQANALSRATSAISHRNADARADANTVARIVRLLITAFDTPEEMRAAAAACRRWAGIAWLPVPGVVRRALRRFADVLDEVAAFVWGRPTERL